MPLLRSSRAVSFGARAQHRTVFFGAHKPRTSHRPRPPRVQFLCERNRQDAARFGAAGCGCGVGFYSDGQNSPADWSLARGHCLSRQTHHLLFSAGNFDFAERGADASVVFGGKIQTLTSATGLAKHASIFVNWRPNVHAAARLLVSSLFAIKHADFRPGLTPDCMVIVSTL